MPNMLKLDPFSESTFNRIRVEKAVASATAAAAAV